MSRTANKKPEPAAAEATPPVFNESIADALIDSARISVMAAIELRPFYERPLIVMPDDEAQPPNVHECLSQAMQWLNAARAMTIEQAALAPTSIHVVNARGEEQRLPGVLQP
jgi:hypothetical protein